MSTFNVGYFVGSLATKSINRLLSKRSCASQPADRVRELADSRAAVVD
ncbi:MAG TPA: hypothetical protein VKH19_10535 [Gemmatimonadaceae bacterium]|nr:hypothetical protein [Gemmatimonadaceae bacterium]